MPTQHLILWQTTGKILYDEKNADWPCLVSTYVVCERLSVMQRQARLSEFFDQIGKNNLFWDLVQNTPPCPQPPPPPPRNEKLARSWHFEFWPYYRTPPPPTPEMKSWPDLGTLSFDPTTEHPHPHPRPENWNLGKSWHFEFWLLQNTPLNKLNFR